VRRCATLILAILSLAAPAGAVAAECPKTTLADVEKEVMCPVCGTPLGLATEAPQAEREREFIRRQVDGCRSEDEIKAALVNEFGENVLALPGNDGFDLAAYLVPGLAVLLGGATVAVTAIGWRRSRARAGADPDTTQGAPTPIAGEADRLQTDLDRYDL